MRYLPQNKLLVGAVILGGLSACAFFAAVVTQAEKDLAHAGAQGVASIYACSNEPQIESDLLQVIGRIVGKPKVVQTVPNPFTQQSGVLGNKLCGPVITALMDEVGNKFPETWQCAGAEDGNTLPKLIQYCEANAPF